MNENKKINLNKHIISSLCNNELKTIEGGGPTGSDRLCTDTPPCYSNGCPTTVCIETQGCIVPDPTATETIS